MANIPNALKSLLSKQYGEPLADEILSGMVPQRPVTLRVNRLKSSFEEVYDELLSCGAQVERVGWFDDAMILKNVKNEDLRGLQIYKDGKIYLQSLSSMIPPLLLDPQAGESILDMAAAPGGKTTQIASLSAGRANITACEKNKIRAERMRFNLERQGVGRVSVMVCDARRLDTHFMFDKILLDAPCSGSGTVSEDSCDFTMELFQRSMRTQRELIKKAFGLLRPGGRLVYSTCSVLAGENEEVLGEALRMGAQPIKIPEDRFPGVPRLPVGIEGMLCVMPTELYEGFFVGVVEKKG